MAQRGACNGEHVVHVGDRVTIVGDIYPITLELNVRAIFQGPDDNNTFFHWEYLQESLPQGWRGAVGTFRNEEGSREFSYTSMVIDPPDGRVPPTTAAARARPRQGGSFGVGPWEKIQDFSLYDRCITRGAIGSFMPRPSTSNSWSVPSSSARRSRTLSARSTERLSL